MSNTAVRIANPKRARIVPVRGTGPRRSPREIERPNASALAVERAAEIMFLLAEWGDGSVTEIAETIGSTGSAVHRRVAELIAGYGPLSVTEPVIMEVLAGARSDQRKLDLRRLLLRFPLLRFDTAADFDAAARIYRRCRAVGFTPRGMIDCMIAAVAWQHGASLLAQDVDLQRLGQIMDIELDQALPAA